MLICTYTADTAALYCARTTVRHVHRCTTSIDHVNDQVRESESFRSMSVSLGTHLLHVLICHLWRISSSQTLDVLCSLFAALAIAFDTTMGHEIEDGHCVARPNNCGSITHSRIWGESGEAVETSQGRRILLHHLRNQEHRILLRPYGSGRQKINVSPEHSADQYMQQMTKMHLDHGLSFRVYSIRKTFGSSGRVSAMCWQHIFTYHSSG